MKFTQVKVARNVYSLLDKRQKKQFLILVFIFTLSSIFEVAGVGSLFPFLSIISNPETMINNEIIMKIKNIFNLQNINQLVGLMGFFSIVLFVVANILGLLNIWIMQRYGWSVQSKMASEMFKEHLYLPYNHFLNDNSSNMTKNIIYETELYLSGCLMPLLHIFAYGIITVFIICFLSIINFKVALIILIFFSLILYTFNFIVKSKLKIQGQKRVSATSLRYKILSECFGAIKEIKILGKEEFFSTLFRRPSNEFSKAMAFGAIIKSLPRYGLEIFGFTIIISWLLFALSKNITLVEIIPILGLYAVAGYRIMPAVTRVYMGINSLQFHKSAIENLLNKKRKINLSRHSTKSKNEIIKNFEIGDLEFDNVSFSYSKSKPNILDNISLKIPAFSNVVLVGLTGSGKSTFINLILGLIKPTKGKIVHQGNLFHENEIFNFQQKVGYVPQSIYLLDDTITSNIALGLNYNEINIEKVIQASKQAQIYEFISSNLSNKFNTIVGEKGARLSGGQIQRIGIARAFYNEPDYLILDEATSNLDVKTENKFLEELKKLKNKNTIIHVSHRNNVIKSADKIFVFEKGRVEVFENYADFENSSFRDLIS